MAALGLAPALSAEHGGRRSSSQGDLYRQGQAQGWRADRDASRHQQPLNSAAPAQAQWHPQRPQSQGYHQQQHMLHSYRCADCIWQCLPCYLSQGLCWRCSLACRRAFANGLKVYVGSFRRSLWAMQLMGRLQRDDAGQVIDHHSKHGCLQVQPARECLLVRPAEARLAFSEGGLFSQRSKSLQRAWQMGP